MNRAPVTSSNILSIGYDPNTLTLEIEFKNGAIYQYYDIPEVEYRNLISAGSIGTYLNQSIKGNYRYTQI
jgi:hypothetical protein